MTRLALLLLTVQLAAVQAMDDHGQTVFGPDKRPAQPAKAQAELKWAKGIVIDFFTTAKSGDAKQATLLMTSALKSALIRPFGGSAEDVLRHQFQSNSISGWAIKDEEMGPDGNEAVFKGMFRGTIFGTANEGVASFVIRVSKEKDEGRWRICLFTVGPWKKVTEGAPKK